jgi:glycosyltransferase involved in cell wall biosynthesis
MLPQISNPRVTISVIVPVHNGGENFRRSLSSLLKAKPSPDEIIVVADGDTDGSSLAAEEFGATVLRLPRRNGPAQARNLGARKARSDILFFVDADIAIPSDAMQQIASIFEQDPELSALFGSYDDEPGATGFLSQYKNLFHHYVHQNAREEASTFWGACGAIRRDTFMSLGGFNEHYRRPSIEDIELGYRLKQAGFRIRLSKKLQVKHLKRWDVISLLRSDFFDRAIPWTELILRDRIFINDLNLRLSSRFSVLLTCLLVAALIGGGWWPESFAVAGTFSLLLFIINGALYRYFLSKRGLWFTIKTIPWHWLYYFYSGSAFAIGLIQFLFFKRRVQRGKFPLDRENLSGAVKPGEGG